MPFVVQEKNCLQVCDLLSKLSLASTLNWGASSSPLWYQKSEKKTEKNRIVIKVFFQYLKSNIFETISGSDICPNILYLVRYLA